MTLELLQWISPAVIIGVMLYLHRLNRQDIKGLRGEFTDLRSHVDTGLAELRNPRGCRTRRSPKPHGMPANEERIRSHMDVGLAELRSQPWIPASPMSETAVWLASRARSIPPPAIPRPQQPRHRRLIPPRAKGAAVSLPPTDKGAAVPPTVVTETPATSLAPRPSTNHRPSRPRWPVSSSPAVPKGPPAENQDLLPPGHSLRQRSGGILTADRIPASPRALMPYYRQSSSPYRPMTPASSRALRRKLPWN